jgi:hypothetical protein
MTQQRRFKFQSASLVLGSVLAVAFVSAACSNDKASFGTGSVRSLELVRNSDGATTNVDAETVYSTADSSAPEIDEAALPDEPVTEEVTADLESKDETSKEILPGGTYDDAPAENGSTSTSTTTSTSGETAEEPEHPGNKKGRGPGERNNENPEAAKAAGLAKAAEAKERRAKAVAGGCSESVITEAALTSCRDSLELGTDVKTDSFRNVSVTGKNMNNKSLFSDGASENSKPTFLNVCAKNVNHSTIELLDPKGVYCIDMRVKNMNTFIFKVHCDAKVSFVNLQRKNANKEETLKVGCKK